jgi:hypothetical protein
MSKVKSLRWQRFRWIIVVMYWGWLGLGDRGFEFPDGEDVAVSPDGRARIRYNRTTNQFEQSLNGAPYTALGNGGGAGGGGGVVTISSTPYAVQSGDQSIRIPGNTIGSAVSITLPLAATFPGRKIVFKNLQLFPATFTTVSTTGSDTLDLGFFTGVIAGDFSTITLQSDGVSDWNLIAAV